MQTHLSPSLCHVKILYKEKPWFLRKCLKMHAKSTIITIEANYHLKIQSITVIQNQNHVW